MNNIISPDDASTEARYAQDIMHSYIKSRSDYERELILSAMMVANRNIGEDAGNVGKALKLFLENMGPAEIKLGQAIASHPNTPDTIRIELQGLKILLICLHDGLYMTGLRARIFQKRFGKIDT